MMKRSLDGVGASSPAAAGSAADISPPWSTWSHNTSMAAKKYVPAMSAVAVRDRVPAWWRQMVTVEYERR